MKALRLLALPWMAWSKGVREVLVGITVLIVATVVLVMATTHQHGVAPSLATIHLIAALVCALWAIMLSQVVLLAREAHRLRLPTLGREARASLALYVSLTIVVPALLLAWLGANGAVAMTELALGGGLGLAYAVLPGWIGPWVILTPIAMDSYSLPRLPMPANSVPGFLAWALPSVIALWMLIGIFWHRSICHDHGLRGASKPALLLFRTKAWYGHNTSNLTESQQISQRPRWWQSIADVRGSGPGHAVTSLRVALGGWAMPQTSTSRLRQLAGWALALGVAAFFAVLGSQRDPRHHHSINSALIYAGIAGPMFAQVHARILQRRWSRANGELPLLALLPGLGTTSQTKRALLQASLLPTLGVQCLLLAVAWGVAIWLQLTATGWLMLLLEQLLGMGMLAAYTLATLGGIRLNDWWHTALVFGVIVLISIGSPMATMPPSAAATPYVLLALAIFWAAIFVPLLRLAQRGWHGLCRRPHPFLQTA